MVLSGNKLWYRSYIRKSHQSKEASGDQNNRLVGDTRSVGIKLGYRHALVFGFVLVVYVYTALPSVPGGDAGELLAEGCQFGIPHPPGYPLLNVLYYALSRVVRSGTLPVPSVRPPTDCAFSTPGTVAWVTNALSGVLGAVTSVLMCLTIEEWTRGSTGAYNRGAAAAGALLFCFSPLTWEYSTGSEVFALNNMLVAGALYLTARIVGQPNIKAARVGAVVCGLALSNQHASALVLAPLSFSVASALYGKSLISFQSTVELAGVWLALGLAPYAALVVSAQNPQQGSWGDLSSMQGLIRHILRQEYGTWKLGIASPGGTEGLLERLQEYLMDSSSQTVHLGPPFALLGLGWAWVNHRKTTDSARFAHEGKNGMRAFGFDISIAWTFYVLFWHEVLSNISLRRPMSRAVHARFWMQPNLLLCLAAGGGFGVALNAASSVIWGGWPRFCRPSRRVVNAVLSITTPCLMGVILVWLQWDEMDRGAWSGRSQGWTMHLHAQALLSSLPERSILLSHTDLDLNAARYLRVCEGLRTDVTHMSLQMMPYPWWRSVQAELHPGIVFPPILRGVSTRRDSEGNAALITRFLAANLARGRPIFLDMQAVDESEIGSAGSYRGFSLVPHGLTYWVAPKSSLPDSERWHGKVVRQLASLNGCMKVVSTNSYRPGTWEFAANSVYWDAHYQAALFFLSYGVGMWTNTPGAMQSPQVVPALRASSALLLQTLEAVDLHDTLSSSRKDLLKNTVLAQVRLYHALKLAVVTASKVDRNKESRETLALATVDKLFQEMMAAREHCLRLIPRFLLEAEDDKDAEAFGKVYIGLREAG